MINWVISPILDLELILRDLLSLSIYVPNVHQNIFGVSGFTDTAILIEALS